MTLNIDRTIARWVLNLSTGKELVQAAVDALVDCYDGPSLRLLASYDVPVIYDISDLVEKCFDELNTTRPDRREAVFFLAREYAEAIVTGSLRPYDGASLIWRQLANVIRPEDNSLDGFVYWADEYEDATDPQRVGYCEEAIIETARHFLATPSGRPTTG